MPEFTKAANKKDVPAGKGIAVDIKDKRIALFHVDGQFYAIDDVCTHAGGSLSEGELTGKVVTCPWHGATFDITSGKTLDDIAPEAVASYPVLVEGDEIKIQI